MIDSFTCVNHLCNKIIANPSCNLQHLSLHTNIGKIVRTVDCLSDRFVMGRGSFTSRTVHFIVRDQVRAESTAGSSFTPNQNQYKLFRLISKVETRW